MSEPSHADLATSIAVLKRRMDEAEKMQAEIRADVKAIRTAVDEGRGGWKIVMMLGIPAAIGASLLAMAQQIFGKH